MGALYGANSVIPDKNVTYGNNLYFFFTYFKIFIFFFNFLAIVDKIIDLF